MGSDGFDGLGDASCIVIAETSAAAVVDPIGVDHDAGPGLGDLRTIDELVGKEGHDHNGYPSGKGAEGRARAAVTDDDLRFREDIGLIDPRLDVDIARDRIELRGVETAPDREKYSGVDLGHSPHRHSKDLGGDRHVPEHGA